MGRGKKTTAFLKECMADALIALIREKPIAHISIDEITARAGVGRVTWFRNFQSKSDAITFKLVLLWQRYAEENALLREGELYTVKNAVDFFSFSYEIRDLFRILHDLDMQLCIYEAFYQIMMAEHADDLVECYRRRFYSYGLFGMLMEWNKRDYKESPAEMTLIFHRLIGNRAIK